jgi:chaperonin cofactor prefoldin
MSSNPQLEGLEKKITALESEIFSLRSEFERLKRAPAASAPAIALKSDPPQVSKPIPPAPARVQAPPPAPKKSKMFIQSLVPEIAELTIYFLNLVTVSRLKQNPTVKNEIKEKGFGEQVPAGFLMYPISQAADMLFLKTNLIPVGEDQLPVIEQANEIVEKFNRIYGETFPKLEPMVGTGRRLSGIDGKAKMSKSLGNAIYLSDPTEEVTKKVIPQKESFPTPGASLYIRLSFPNGLPSAPLPMFSVMAYDSM